MKNNYYKCLMLVILLLCLNGCSTKSEEPTTLNISFSEYYQTASDYEKIYPLLNEYFYYIQKAYDKSDKENLNSFVLLDGYNNVAEQLSTISNDYSEIEEKGILNIGEDYMAKLKLLEPFLRMEVQLAKKNLLSSPNVDWYEETNKLLTDTYNEYDVGNGDN